MQESDFSNVQEQNEALTAQSASGSSDHMKQVSVRQTVSQTGQPLKGQVIYQNHIRKQPSKGQDSCQPNGSPSQGSLSSFSSMHIQDADPRVRNRADKNRFDSCKTETEMGETNRSEITGLKKTAKRLRLQDLSSKVRESEKTVHVRPETQARERLFPAGPAAANFIPMAFVPASRPSAQPPPTLPSRPDARIPAMPPQCLTIWAASSQR